MHVPISWLKEYVDVTTSPQEIADKLTMGGLEVEGIEDSPIGPVLDVYITPNRGDCLSIVGVARELAALYDIDLKLPTQPMSDPSLSAFPVQIVSPELCPRYVARVVHNVRQISSPGWMQARLEAAGMRPIRLVVDVTNYVMLELGQPLHAFDMDKIDGGIVVRQAEISETLVTLDKVKRELVPPMLVIADHKKALAVAGVMGGLESEVTSSTKNILLESAHFQSLSVRRTSRALDLKSEASYRFERVVDPAGCRRAVDRACQLLAELGRGVVDPGVTDIMPTPIVGKDITVRVSRVRQLLGMPDIDGETVQRSLERLQIGVHEQDSDTFVAHIPPLRSDLTIEEDLIEEIGRIYGYENIPERLPFGNTTQGGDSPLGKFLMQVRRSLVCPGW